MTLKDAVFTEAQWVSDNSLDMGWPPHLKAGPVILAAGYSSILVLLKLGLPDFNEIFSQHIIDWFYGRTY